MPSPAYISYAHCNQFDSNEAADAGFMAQALAAARTAAVAGEVPVGAVVVKDGVVIATGHNTPVAAHDPTGHAEINALREAARVLGNYRLDGCELFVTLEPCAMCSGAMLHARLKRVVFGASEPRSGAAGSVLNLFAETRLNHQTRVQGGVLGQECAELLQGFFQQQRSVQRAQALQRVPVRDDAVRTTDARFEGLPAYPWQPRYVSELPALAGLRMHYLDEVRQGQGSAAPLTWLCLHGNPAWSYLYRKMLPVFTAAGHRVVAPDMPGFGRSDKPKKESAHHFLWHRQVLLELVEHLDLHNVVLVVQDWGGLLGLTLPMAAPGRYRGVLLMNTLLATGDAPLSPGFVAWREMCARKPDFEVGRLLARGNPGLSPQECAAYDAPFADRGHRAALRAFPRLVPEVPDDEGAAVSRQARTFWQQEWAGQSLMVVGAQDPVLGLPVMDTLRQSIRGCPPPRVLPHAGHFVQEHGEAIAHEAVEYFRP